MHLFADPYAYHFTCFSPRLCVLARMRALHSRLLPLFQVLPSVVVQEAAASAEVKAAVLQVLVQVRRGEGGAGVW